MRIAITGANSSVGRALLRHVADHGNLEARAGARTPEAIATLPRDARITPCLIDYGDGDSLASLLEDVDCLVHLAGILIEHASSTYQTANVEPTRAVVDACRRANVNHVVFISSLGADPRSNNSYYRSKGEAEQLVAGWGGASTIIRTPMLLGPGTAGAVSLLRMASRPSVRVVGGGRHVLRPLDVDDLSQAILNCCHTPADGAAAHALVGPESVTHRDLIVRMGQLTGQRVSVTAIPVWAAKSAAAVAGRFRSGGMTPDVIDVITAGEVVRTNADVALRVI